MDFATSFAGWEGSEIHVAHAWRLPGESSLQAGRVRIPALRLEEIVQGQRNMHADTLAHLLAPYGMTLDSPHVHFEKGVPASFIAELAADLPADLVIIGTVGRTGIPGFFIGNTAESIIQMTDLPVLTVKPRGFTTPVQI